MSVTLWILAGAGLFAAAVVYVLYMELRNQHHIWHAACVTPPETRKDIETVLGIFGEVMEGKNITWWLDYGTLLGAWRVAGTMAFDHDLDLSFLATDEAKIRACKDEFASRGIDLNMERTSIFYGGKKLGDLEPWYRYGDKYCRDDPAKREGIMKYWRPLVDDIPAARLTPLWAVRFNGKMYPCPNHPERHLRRRYLTCRLNLRLVIPHKQKCWFCAAFWREAARIWNFRGTPALDKSPQSPR